MKELQVETELGLPQSHVAPHIHVCTGSVKTQTHPLKYEVETKTLGVMATQSECTGLAVVCGCFCFYSTTFTESVRRVAQEVRFLHVHAKQLLCSSLTD